jgi:hypothetical protein
MYIIACIEDRTCYWSYSKLYMSLEAAEASLKRLEEKGEKNINIFKIMDLSKIE